MNQFSHEWFIERSKLAEETLSKLPKEFQELLVFASASLPTMRPIKVYCCYGAYAEAGHSADCSKQHGGVCEKG